MRKLIEEYQGQNLKLHDHISPQFAKVLETIGFDKVYTRAEGVSLFDNQGQEYFDFLSGYGVYSIGRNHPEIKKVLIDYIGMDSANLIQMEAPLMSGILAKKLLEIFGHGVRDIVYFTNSGTESNESAIKFARCATGRPKLLHLDHAFHGLTTGSLAVNGNVEFREGFGELLASEMIPLNDLNQLEDKLKTKEFAAFIFEPIQGKGVYVPEPGFLKQAVQLCKKYGTISISDEVQSGLGRTGKWLAGDHEELEPDIITISKALSGGMVPVGAVIYKREIYDKVFSRMDRCVVHSSTFGQNNLAMVCGLATLDILQKENLLAHAEKIGELLRNQLNQLKTKHDIIKEVRGRGLMIGIELGKPSELKKKIAWEMIHKMNKGLFGELVAMPMLSKHRILTQVSGHHQDIIKLLPPLVLQKSHVEYFVSAFDEVLSNAGQIGSMVKMGKNLAKHAVRKTG